MIDYKYKEPTLLAEMQDYINRTYSQHYASGHTREETDPEYDADYEQDVQAFQLMLNDPYGAMCFARYSTLKYVLRLGKKAGFNRDDLKKAMHFSLLAMFAFDKWQYQEKRALEAQMATDKEIEKQKIVDQINADALANLSQNFAQQVYYGNSDK